MTRRTLSVVMAVAVAVGAYGVASAQGQGPARGRGWGPEGGPAGALLMLRGLELSEQQRQQLREIREAQPADGRQAFAVERQLHRQLAIELVADAPDTQKLAELQRQIADAQTARLARQVELGQQMAQVLTPEQRSTLRERLAQAHERRAPGARRGPGQGAGR